MNTVLARAILALGLIALPASALASTKSSTKHSHSVAKKDANPKKKGTHLSHKSNGSKAVAAAPAKASSVAAKTASALRSDQSASKAP
jgi:hypothetical protein